MQTQPDYGPAVCVLGLIDAGLGRKEEALREGRRAVELLPVAKDSINDAHVIEYFAIYRGLGRREGAGVRAITACPAHSLHGNREVRPVKTTSLLGPAPRSALRANCRLASRRMDAVGASGTFRHPRCASAILL